MVLVFEDLHWAEPTPPRSPRLLLSAQATTAPIFVLGVARPELLERRPEWLTADAITLGPLSTAEGESLIEQLADVPSRLRATILSTAGGNPLFVEQLLAHASEGETQKRLLRRSPPCSAAGSIGWTRTSSRSFQRAAVVGREFDSRAVEHLRPEGFQRDRRRPRRARSQRVPGKARQRRCRLPSRAHPRRGLLDVAEGPACGASRAVRSLACNCPPVADEVVGFHLEQAHSYLDRDRIGWRSCRGARQGGRRTAGYGGPAGVEARRYDGDNRSARAGGRLLPRPRRRLASSRSASLGSR